MRRFAVPFPAMFLLLSAPSAVALERALLPVDDDAWTRSSPCPVQYYNTCVDWYREYPMNAEISQVGVLIDACGPEALLEESRVWVRTDSYAAYSMISVHSVDAEGTPHFPPLAEQPIYVPNCGAGCYDWWISSWNITVPATFMLLIRHQSLDDLQVHADYSGPGACGVCYPTSRVSRTFVWPQGEITGPGAKLSLEGCDLELLMRWTTTSVIPVDPTSWGGVKALYR